MHAAQEAWLILRSLLALAVVVLVAFIVLRMGLPWLLRHRMGQRTRHLHVEEFYPLDRNHRLYLVRWDQTWLLLGTSPDRVQVLFVRPETSGPSFEAALEQVASSGFQKEE
ncbi:MAG: flagellar biosynthetic protein FliO [Acidobacteria bacterium]|nr:flagellar biosynthetic protein FliO [Acidobacteriota bacterium]MDW7984560.1 flagellar biosynthetic protein FliO [Acidobacteriota bacterium]